MAAPTAAPEDLGRRVAELDWYHTLELPPGVVTPGWFDTRPVPGLVGLPADLSGKRCLDVGTFNGFWAFEMERRGAAEVVAIDLLDPSGHDWPLDSKPQTVAGLWERKGEGNGFEIAREALGSSVIRRERSVYDLDPAEDGEFDFVYVGSILLHLRDPVKAIEAVRGVCRGEALFVDAIDLFLTLLHRDIPLATLDARGRPWWWKPTLAGLVRMVEAGGFTPVDEPRRLFIPPGAGQPRPPLRPDTLLDNARRLLTKKAYREVVLAVLKGDPHAAVRARPAR